MVVGAMVAVLRKLHADRVDLVGSASIPFAPGVFVPEMISPGSRVTILYSRNDDGDGMLVQSIKAE
jgi:hypothetical protein